MPLTDKSYASLAEADAFWSDRNDSGWAAATTEEKTAALIRSTEYIDGSFSWIGSVAEDDQVLDWPRKNAVDREGRTREGVPVELKNAASWLAKEALSQELDPATSRGGELKSVKAGPVEVEWAESSSAGIMYKHITRMLRDLTVSSQGQHKLVRS